MIKGFHPSQYIESKLYTPQRTQATEAESNFKQLFSNGSFGFIEQSNIIKQQSVLPNESIVSFHCVETSNQDMQELLRQIQIVRFLSSEIQKNESIIHQKQKIIHKLKIQRQDKQHQNQTLKKQYYRHRKALSTSKSKISQKNKQKSYSIDQKINRLKYKIAKMKSLSSQQSHSIEKQLSDLSILNSFGNVQCNNKRKLSRKRFYTDGQTLTNNFLGKEKKRRPKIYIPIYVHSSMQPLPFRNQMHPYPHNHYDRNHYPPNMKPNQVQSPQHSNNPDQRFLDQSFTQKLHVFTSRLEGELSKRNSDLEYSQSRKTKKSSQKDRGSYILSEIRGSNKSATANSRSKQLHQPDQQQFYEDYERAGYSKMGFKVTTSNTQEIDQIQYPPLRKKVTEGKKQNSIPIIEQINNSTVYVDIYSEKRQNSSSDRDTIEKKYSSGRSNSRKQNAEQSAVDIDANILDMLQNSPIRQQSEFSSSPQSFRIRAREDQLGQSTEGEPIIKLQGIKQLNIHQKQEFYYNKQPSITSKYESTPRRLAETKQQQPNNHLSKIDDRLNFLDVLQLNPVSRISREAKSSDQKASFQEQEEEDELLRSIKLSTESVFSRGKKYNSSAIQDSKKSSFLGEREASQSDIKDSKKVRKTMATGQRGSEQLDLAQQIRTTTPSRIVKGGLVKKKFKRDNQLMRQSIEEANEDQEDPVSGKIRTKKSQGSIRNMK